MQAQELDDGWWWLRRYLRAVCWVVGHGRYFTLRAGGEETHWCKRCGLKLAKGGA
jgi:hypothetical protein